MKMIIGIEEILDDLEAKYPEVSRDSLRTISSIGLRSILRHLKASGEFLINGRNHEEMKFYKPLPKALQRSIAKKRYQRKQRENAKTNSNK